MENLKVSVVIPAYCAHDTIKRAIDSVLSQTYAAHEILVIDDGSPDAGASLVEETYGARVTVLRKVNGGAASARNFGIERASGDLIAFLDADDYWEPQKLAKQVEVARANPEIGLIAGKWFEQLPGQVRQAVRLKCSATWFDKPLKLGGKLAFQAATLTSTCMVLVTRKALGEMRFRTDLKTAEDRDLWVRIAAANPIYFTSDPLSTAVCEPGSLSRSAIEGDCRNMLEVIASHKALLGRVAARQWKSYVLFRWAANEQSPRLAASPLLRSLLLWPAPYSDCPNAHRFGRLKRLAVLTLIAAGVRR